MIASKVNTNTSETFLADKNKNPKLSRSNLLIPDILLYYSPHSPKF